MEYKKLCKTCGKVYCYTDADLKKNTQNAAMSAISAIGGLASIFGGTIFHTAHLSNQTDKYSDKVVDYTKCPYCNSRNVVLVSDAEYSKIANNTEIGVASSKKIEVSPNATPESLIKRANIFLEDGEWDYADAYADSCLDAEPENANAYIIKLMSELKIKNFEDLANCRNPFNENNNYKKAIRFADEELKLKLDESIRTINERNNEERLNSIYNDAKNKMYGSIENYKSAIALFNTIIDWKDSRKQIECCEDQIKYIIETKEKEKIAKDKQLQAEREEKARIAKRNTKITLVALSTTAIIAILIVVINTVILPTYRKNAFIEKYGQGVYEKFGCFEKGTYISFGGYEQDNDFTNGKEEIEWLVLEEEENKIFVISKYVLDKKSYNDTSEDITWETSTIREWLNDEFVNSAFNDEEKSMICTTTVSADDNPRFQTYPGKETSDKVFLLSIDECNKYLPWTSGVDVGACSPTEYVVEQNLSVSDEHKVEGRSTCRWWLRTPGSGQHKGAFVTYSGGVWDEGCDAVGEQRFLYGTVYGVRPAMWIELK